MNASGGFRPLKIAFLVPDNRENFRKYHLPEPYFGTAPTALLQGFEMLCNQVPNSGGVSEFEIHVISCTQKSIPSPGRIGANIWYHSLHVPKAGWLRSGYSGCISAVRRKLNEISPDIVHAQGTERDCALSAALSPYPRLLTIHGNLRLIRKQLGFKPFSALWLQSFIEGFVVPRFDGVICITNYTRLAVEGEVPRTWVVPNAVDPMFLELGKKKIAFSLPLIIEDREQQPIVLIVANIDPRKNQNDFIQALDEMEPILRFKARFFGLCGDDKYSREFRELVAGRPWCHYGGMISREALFKEFEAASMLALPTHEDNCPMVVLEAMAAGVPVMASKVGGIPDLIDGVSTGLFCNPADPQSFRDVVSRLLTDPDFTNRLVANAYKDSITRFHPKVIAMKHLEIYQQVLNR